MFCKLGARIDKKYIHKILRNRIYLGELSHKGQWYPGAHPAIVDHGLWGQVDEFLNQNAHQRSVKTKLRSRTDSLLRGLLYSPTGERMHPSYTRKQGKQYRYYISRSESRFGSTAKTHERIPADGIEAAAISQIKTVLTSPEAIASVCACIKYHKGQIDEANAVLYLLCTASEIYGNNYFQPKSIVLSI